MFKNGVIMFARWHRERLRIVGKKFADVVEILN
jgi:hypothetical protein